MNGHADYRHARSQDLRILTSKAVVIDGSECEIPFPGTDRERIEIDEYRIAAIVMKYIADTSIAMNDPSRQHKVEIGIASPEFSQHPIKKISVSSA